MKLNFSATDLNADPLVVFEQLASSHENCFLLETAVDKYQPEAISYIGVDPTHVYAAKGGTFIADHEATEVSNPYAALRRLIQADPTLPDGFVGGLVGYFSHESIQYLEPSLKFTYPRDFCDFQFGEYNDGLVFKNGQAPHYFHYGDDRANMYAGAEAGIGALSIEFVGSVKDKPNYQDMIERAREDIQNGRIFQVVLGNRYEYSFTGDLLALYRELRDVNPSPFMFFLKFGNMVTLGASPELLVHTEPDGDVTLEVLAGTIRRGKSPVEDAALAKSLLGDSKEIAEHSMLVDLARNDLGRVSRIGSVQIDHLMYVKQLSHVQHISSIVSGKLEEGMNAFDALASSFPAGTVSGAPKIEAIKMIADLEGAERGPYGGTIGYMSFNGDSIQAANMRSVSAIGDKLFLHSASGIVYDSNSEREFAEISEKKAAMDKAMRPFLRTRVKA